MKIEKVYNNNVVQARSSSGREMIVMGRGLGFQKKTGETVDSSLIEKKFILEDNQQADELSRVYLDLSPEETESVLAIIEHGQEILGTAFDTSLYIALADHLHYTLQRLSQNLSIPNPLSWEIRKFFPKEFQVGQDALNIIAQKLQVDVPETEVSAIALHFINAQKDSSLLAKGQEITKLVTNILEIVRLHYGEVADEDAVSYNRFVTHVQYFAQRVINGLVQGQNDAFLFQQVRQNYPKAFFCSEKIKNYVEKRYDFPMSRDEQVYLTIHLQRLDTVK
ncbi:PRD domain-containing protein [Streptococcus chenjunshii]|uniref:PRD domain-containing protein n=1 Tax=Streptococcus chenjunshii TaxID=2173853 RepID=A0A372KPQ6_9STRE|nr:PRD domain-containing protein [Streptococcus chenjunshii]AXQ78772.1 PRD domain-containing protein [Streptococcus chenjunshii]RFU51635.1 PRD domain-containing protein [Streptococcus chenjunshii]RFU53956.1 PRD domain-containing protein [Streptococcus chenjunshii]